MTILDTPALESVDLGGELPRGTTVLEASAGTGKTYAIAALVTRYVAEDRARLDQMLVVTFSRAASGELRSRVRARLAETRDALADPAGARESEDEVVAALADASDAEVDARRRRLAEALADYDAATIATIHQFCQEALRGLGVVADVDQATTLAEDLGDLVDEVCDDVYLRLVSTEPARRQDFPHGDARAVARAAALEDPQALLVPADAREDSLPGFRTRFADEVRTEVERRKCAQRLQGFDDLLVRTRDALTDPVAGEFACARLRDRYQVVLVDEFQDTDPVQWDVFATAFHGSRTLILIGDPKQAIYGFRGGDIRTYLKALDAADRLATLDRNWRSDRAVLDGLQTVFRGAALGDPRIVVRPVTAGHTSPALLPEADTPVQLRLLQGAAGPKGTVGVDVARPAVAADVAAQVRAHLDGGLTVVPRKGTAGPRPLTCGDVAVLVRTTKQGRLVRDALTAVGLPSVLTGTSSVFATAAAADWLLLLEALARPHRGTLVRRLALTPWVGWSAAQLDERGSEATDALADSLRAWADVLARRGVAALYATAAAEHGVAERLLGRLDGERLLTDLRHVGEALHAEALRARLGLSGLLAWLRARVREARDDQEADQERARRLETDAAAVQIVTVHASKGLEFPVVFVPYGWDTSGGRPGEKLPRTHAGDRRARHVGGKGAADYQAACSDEADDTAGEELRLLYVAATRAVSRLVLWWAPGTKTEHSPLHWLLFCGDPAVDVPADGRPAVQSDAATLVAAQRVAGQGAGGVRVVGFPAPGAAGDGQGNGSSVAGAGDLSVAAMDRTVDTEWRPTSYTRLTAAAHERPGTAPVDPDLQGHEDETDALVPDPDPTDGDRDDRLREIASPMADLPGGTAFGNLVHAVLEDVLRNEGDPADRLRAAARRQLGDRPGGLDPEDLATALEPALSTTLGPLAAGRALRDIAPRHVLPEMRFELALDGGDRRSGGDIRLVHVAGLVRDLLPASDRMAGYARALDTAAFAERRLRGFLTGSIDAVVRVCDDAGQPRYVVIDHKTNRLADRSDPLTAWHYRPEALDDAMTAAHYPLQALLYQVALHRFLRWRQPGYVPDQHLGGVLYLFLRGMCGEASAGAGELPGVWSWTPPAALVVALSDLLGGAR